VKFTPSGYPATITGGKFFVGDGDFPGPFLETEFGVAIFDDNGAGGLPGAMLDSTGVTVNNYGWVSLDWLNATIEDGSFYLAMYQRNSAPNAAPSALIQIILLILEVTVNSRIILGAFGFPGFYDPCMGQRPGRRCPRYRRHQQYLEGNPQDSGKLEGAWLTLSGTLPGSCPAMKEMTNISGE